MSHHHGPHCGCRRIVYPVMHNCVHRCTESSVEHVHPMHTTVMNHHLQRNIHVYPHSTSQVYTGDSVDIYGGSFQVPNPPQGAPGFMPFYQEEGAMGPVGLDFQGFQGYPGFDFGNQFTQD